MYYMQTGETLFGGKKDVVIKKNITDVEIYNCSFEIKNKFNRFIEISGNYTFNHSEIISFKENNSLAGKILTYSPEHTANFGVSFFTKYVNLSVSNNFVSKQFISDDNTEFIDAFYTLDAKIITKIKEHYFLSLSVQNILNKQYIVYYEQLSLGRFITCNFKIVF